MICEIISKQNSERLLVLILCLVSSLGGLRYSHCSFLEEYAIADLILQSMSL